MSFSWKSQVIEHMVGGIELVGIVRSAPRPRAGCGGRGGRGEPDGPPGGAAAGGGLARARMRGVVPGRVRRVAGDGRRRRAAAVAVARGRRLGGGGRRGARAPAGRDGRALGAGGALLASCGVDGALRVWARGTAEGGPARRLLAGRRGGGARAVLGGRAAGGGSRRRRRAGVGGGRGPSGGAAVPLEGAVHALCAPARGALLLVACTTGVLKVFDLDEVARGGPEQGAGPAPLLVDSCAHDLGALCAAAAGAAPRPPAGTTRRPRVAARGQGRALRAAERLAGHDAAVTALRWARGVLASAALDRSARVWAPPARAPRWSACTWCTLTRGTSPASRSRTTCDI
ncbi:hypothetical protein MSG28_012112 [Choristoneura fumiferana]|uniref:Uncharacterized protein n=1 Tax=Choristoneura fumiferana TaxID=7141 RepID=A0ACC0KBX4_CHOFU|nr:hypothetical protein MSG28_012112 [Choristoneura fumiferana]